MKTSIILFLCASLIVGESKISIDASKSKIEILGTSSLHDWESTAEQFTISGTIGSSVISDLNVEVQVSSIESGKSIMDDKTQEALKSKKFPKIIFKANELDLTDGKVSGPGTLTIAGESRPFQIEAKALNQSNNNLLIKGEAKLKMSDYGVDPPTAMFGTLTTGDEVTIQYEILLTN